MDERRCRFCGKSFQPSKFQPGQMVCSAAACQQRRKHEYRKQKLASDAEYRQVCRDSAQKWRAEHSDYWRQYRRKKPETVARNREQQKDRDQVQRLRDLANNTSAIDLKHSVASIWLLDSGVGHLANNISASAQVWVMEALPLRKGPGRESCKQQPAGISAASAG
jgi:hypothetical protein